MANVEETLRKLENVRKEIKVVHQQQMELKAKMTTLKEREKILEEQYCSMKTKEASKVEWVEKTFPWSDSIKTVLNTTFKIRDFKDQQLAAINAVMSKKDVILIMPTGGGKSLCYQLPAMATKGITLVISPLISLIDDQLISLKALNIHAATLNASNNKTDSKYVYDALAFGKGPIKMIYVTPEWIAKSKRFMTNLQKCDKRKALELIAIDEVHCCSQWGHDFRPDYQYLSIFKAVFPEVPIIGLTATATDNIVMDTQKMLNLQGCTVIRASNNRVNLYYKVCMKPATEEECITRLETMIKNKYDGMSGIIYTCTINDCVHIAKELNDRNIRAACYHANLDIDVRRRRHERWLSKDLRVIVGTIAFGMGIDSPGVRFVIHHCLPKSLENYYQECGRAGRDNLTADCVLLYSLKDITKMSSIVSTNTNGSANLLKMIKYCTNVTSCRRELIAAHFQEEWTPEDCNKMCDHCKHPTDIETIDITAYANDIFKILDEADKTDVRLTAIKLLGSFLQNAAGPKLLKELSKPLISKEFGERIIAHLLVEQYLKEDLHFTAYATVIYFKRGPKSYTPSQILITIPRKTSVNPNKRVRRSS